MATRMMDKIDQAVIFKDAPPALVDVKRVYANNGLVTGTVRIGYRTISVQHVGGYKWEEK